MRFTDYPHFSYDAMPTRTTGQTFGFGQHHETMLDENRAHGVLRSVKIADSRLRAVRRSSRAGTPASRAGTPVQGLGEVAFLRNYQVTIPSWSTTGDICWRNSADMPSGLGAALKAAFGLYINDSTKERRWNMYTTAKTDCALTDVIARGNPHSEFDGPWKACNRCTTAKRPCAKLVEHEGLIKLGFYPLRDGLREESDPARIGFYVVVKEHTYM
jgi:hypothetical protein